MQPFFLFRFEQDEYDRRQREHGAVAFTAADLAALASIWEPAHFASQDHKGADFTLPSGQGFRVSAEAIYPPPAFDHDWARASMKHIATQWGGKVGLGLNADADPDYRLWTRAYAEIYGVELHDANELGPHALKAAQLARLPAMRAQVRARHADAPPARPDEARHLAAMYAARYPFRTPAAA